MDHVRETEPTWRRIASLTSLAGSAGSALASAAASICCIGPLGIALLGVQGAILAAAIRPHAVHLLGGSLVLLGIAFWSVCGRASQHGGTCSVRVGKLVRGTLWASLAVWAAAVIIQFAANRYWS